MSFKKTLPLFAIMFSLSAVSAQNFPEPQMLRKFKADTLALDEINQDTVHSSCVENAAVNGGYISGFTEV